MPTNPSCHATLAEWRTILAGVKHYREYLATVAPEIKGEDEQLVAFDDLERLDRITASFNRQLEEYIREAAKMQP